MAMQTLYATTKWMSIVSGTHECIFIHKKWYLIAWICYVKMWWWWCCEVVESTCKFLQNIIIANYPGTRVKVVSNILKKMHWNWTLSNCQFPLAELLLLVRHVCSSLYPWGFHWAHPWIQKPWIWVTPVGDLSHASPAPITSIFIQ